MEGKKDINYFISVLHLISLLLLILIFLILLKSFFYENGTLEFNFFSINLRVIIIGVGFILLFITYKLIFLVQNSNTRKLPDDGVDIVIFFMSFFMIAFFNYRIGNNENLYNNLFLFFIAVIAIKFGVRYGIASLIVCSVAVVFSNMLNRAPITVDSCIEADLMTIITLILISWLIGKFITFLEEEVVHRTRLETITELAGKVAQEIRNPLVPIKGYIQLEKEKADSSIDSKTVDLLLSEVRKIEDIVTEFLMLGENQPLKLTKIDLGRFIVKTKNLIEPLAILENKNFEITMDKYYPYIEGDELLLRHAFMRITRSAFEKTCEGDGLKIELLKEPGDNNIIIKYILNYMGTSDRIKEDDESQLRNLLKRDDFELIMSERIIQKHKGQMDILFDDSGQVVNFTIYLPITQNKPKKRLGAAINKREKIQLNKLIM